MNIYVGNLSYTATEGDLQEAFGRFGKVDSARVIMDKYTNQSKGFGFVEMSGAEEAKAAIKALDGQEIKGRAVRINEARPKTEGGGGGGGGGRSYGGGGDRGGDRGGGGGGGRSRERSW